MKNDLGFAMRWIAVGVLVSVVITLTAGVVYLPTSRIIGEFLDDERPLTVTYVDPTFGSSPVVTKLWDAPSLLHVWPDDYLNAPQAYGSVVYVVNEYHDARLTAIDTTTHQVLWRTPVATMTYGEMTVDDRYIYLRESANLVAIDRTSGDRVWERRLLFSAGDLVIGEHLILIDSTWNKATQSMIDQVVALDRATGSEVWRSPLGEYVGLATDADMVLVLTETSLRSLSPDTGSVLWDFPVGLPDEVRSFIVHGDLAIISEGQSVVIALDLTQRTERWRFGVGPSEPVPGMQLSATSIRDLVVTDIAVVFSRWSVWVEGLSGGRDNALRRQQLALDRETGKPIWTTTSRIYANPVAVGDRVFALTDDGHVLVEFDARTGAERWRIRIDEPYHNHRPDFIVFGDAIYLTNYDDVYEVRPGG